MDKAKKDLENLIRVRIKQGAQNNIEVSVQEILFETDRYFTNAIVEEILVDIATMPPLRFWQRGIWAQIQHMIARKWRNADD